MITFEEFKALVLKKLDEYDKDTASMEDKKNPTQLSEESWWEDFLGHVGINVDL